MLPRVCVTVGPEYGFDMDSMDPAFRRAMEGQAELLPLEVALAEATTAPVVVLVCFAHSPITADLVQRLSPHCPLKAVVNYGVGTDHLALQDLRALGIPVTNTPGVLSDATADMAWALLMACARRIPQGHRYCAEGQFTEYKNMLFLGKAVAGTTLGIVGLGRIGEQVARRAQGFGMTVLYHNRHRRVAEEAELGVQYAGLEELLGQSDYVVLCCPCTAATQHLLNASRLRLMKRTASLINVGRGPLVDTPALVEALATQVLDSAGLDVFDPEPLPVDHPLLKLDNVVLAPHRGSGTAEARHAMVHLVLGNLQAALAGQPLITVCN